MKMLIMKMMIMSSTVISFIKNPITMGLILLMHTIMMVILINKLMINSWFTMITFLMMVGGLLIMIMYMSSVASNEKFEMKFKLLFIMTMIMLLIDELIMENQINENSKLMMSTDLELSLIKIYNMKSMLITMMLVMYLLLTMISVSTIVKHNKGPLRMYLN